MERVRSVTVAELPYSLQEWLIVLDAATHLSIAVSRRSQWLRSCRLGRARTGC